MRKVSIIMFMLLTSVVALSQTQQPPQYSYQLNYYANRDNPLDLDQTTRVINPGTQGTPLTPKGANGVGEGTICADVYVFDARQELSECCGCVITANGMREFSLRTQLTDNALTGSPSQSGVIAIVADDGNQCDPTAPHPVPQLLAWQTHIQHAAATAYVITEDGFKEAPLDSETELAFLGSACSFVQYLGTGRGVCNCGIHAVG